jgi:hypothetical protein
MKTTEMDKNNEIDENNDEKPIKPAINETAPT